jgi:hypothetical protein
MANRGSRKKIPLTIKEISLVSRVICYIATGIAIIACVLSAVYAIHKMGLLNTAVDSDYLVANAKYDTMFMIGSHFDTENLYTMIEAHPKEYIKFTALVYAKYSIQYAVFAIILCAIIVFLDFDNLKNPFTKKSTNIVDIIIGCTMVMFFVNIIINYNIKLVSPDFVDRINHYVYPVIYVMATFGLLIFNYCLNTGRNMLDGGK